ncbi:MAG: translation elongation factor Ts [Candidatus Brocadiia bacterium]|nr:translation elongation factor Ts [Planctomycetota bacterium]
MGVSANEVKELRDKTGAGLMDCKRALVEAEGDQDEAIRVLRERGMAEAEKKRARTAEEGIICQYIHPDDKLGVLLELNCETDFVARNEEFQNLGREICMQIAAMDPMVVRREEVSDEVIEREKEIYAQQVDDKPDHVIDQIVEGKLEKFFSTNCLVDQAWIRDDAKTIGEIVDEAIAKMGEKIKIQRFVRMEVGEEHSED